MVKFTTHGSINVSIDMNNDINHLMVNIQWDWNILSNTTVNSVTEVVLPELGICKIQEFKQ